MRNGEEHYYVSHIQIVHYSLDQNQCNPNRSTPSQSTERSTINLKLVMCFISDLHVWSVQEELVSRMKVPSSCRWRIEVSHLTSRSTFVFRCLRITFTSSGLFEYDTRNFRDSQSGTRIWKNHCIPQCRTAFTETYMSCDSKITDKHIGKMI